MPASDTGAFELAMWNLLGPKKVDVVHFDVFSKTWFSDIKSELKLPYNELTASPGSLPDLNKVSKDNDVVFAQNGTTTGVKLPNFDWIAADRTGITMNDATSAIFSQTVDWSKQDVLT